MLDARYVPFHFLVDSFSTTAQYQLSVRSNGGRLIESAKKKTAKIFFRRPVIVLWWLEDELQCELNVARFVDGGSDLPQSTCDRCARYAAEIWSDSAA
jgi:hypothetical protein